MTTNDDKNTPLLKVEDLAVSFYTESGLVHAVNKVNITIYPQQTVAVVGESGCGKSVSAMSTLQLIPTPPGRYERGSIHYKGKNLLEYNEKQMCEIRGDEIAMIFQEPMTSLNPVYTIGDQILEAILLHRKLSKEEATGIAEQALKDVGIADARSRLKEYPHQLSGGMRQRIMIAMALACQPTLLLADEPTTALDVTIQAQILELLRRLQHEHNMSMMLITHDLGVVAENADVVAVMYAGRVVEYANVHEIFENPLHPYTKGLFASMPRLGHHCDRLLTIPDQVPDHDVLPDGFTFTPPESADRKAFEHYPILYTLEDHDTNPMSKFLIDTATADPTLYEIKKDHWVACWTEDGGESELQTRPDLQYRRSDDVAQV